MDTQDTEMTDLALRANFAALIEEAALAFLIDPRYATEVVTKAKGIEARKSKKNSRV